MSFAGSHHLSAPVLLGGLGTLAAAAALTSAFHVTGAASDFRLSGNIQGLYPSARMPMTITVQNQARRAIDIVAIDVSSTSSNRAGCPANVVSSPGWVGSKRVPAGGSAKVAVPIRMAASAGSVCRNTTFRLAIVGRAIPR